MNIERIEPRPQTEPTSSTQSAPKGSPKAPFNAPQRKQQEDEKKKGQQEDENEQPTAQTTKMTKPFEPHSPSQPQPQPQSHAPSSKETPKEPTPVYITPQKHASIFEPPKKEIPTDKKAAPESLLSPMHLPHQKKTPETSTKGQAATEKESAPLTPTPKAHLRPVQDTKEEKFSSPKTSVPGEKKEIKKDAPTQQSPTQGIYSPQFTTQQAQDVAATAAVHVPPEVTYDAFVKVVVSITSDTRNTEVILGDGTTINITKDPQDNHLTISVQTPSDKVQAMINANAAALVEVLAGKHPPIQATIQPVSINLSLKPHRIVEGTQNEGGPH